MELTVRNRSNATLNNACSSNGTDSNPKIDISIPGLNRVCDKSVGKTQRIIWFIVMLFCGIVCLWLTVDRLREYFRHPTASKTTIERKDKVQFPPISICVFDPDCYTKMLLKEITKKSDEKNISNRDINEIAFQKLDINVQQVWDKCSFISVTKKITFTDELNDSSNFVITKRHTVMGNCVVIKHIREVKYLSLLTVLRIEIREALGLSVIAFIPHGESGLGIYEYEIISQEMEFLPTNYSAQIKIREEVFELQNIPGRECYDLNSEKERLKKKFLSTLRHDICRLPFLSNKFPQCNTFGEFTSSLNEYQSVSKRSITELAFHGRPVCKRTIYQISLDYIIPSLMGSTSEADNTSTTRLAIKFADNTRVIVSEYFSYTFPALVSDLFAFWGFFLCLSALVFAEIIEFLLFKTYAWFQRRRTRTIDS